MPTFSKSLESAVHKSLQIANFYSHENATLEHILIALTEEPDAAASLYACGGDLAKMRQYMIETILDDDDFITSPKSSSEATPTEAFQRVIQRGAIRASSSGKNPVTGTTVLIALFAERESRVVQFLIEHGITRYDLVNFDLHNVRKISEDVDINSEVLETIQNYEPLPSLSKKEIAARRKKAAERETQARREVKRKQSKVAVATSTTHTDAQEATISSIVQNKAPLAMQARSIELQIEAEIRNRYAQKPNFQTDSDQENFERQLDFLQEIAKSVGGIAEQLASIQSGDTDSVFSAAENMNNLKDKILNFCRNNRDGTFWLGQMPAMLGFVSLFHLAGAHMASATPLIMALCGGDRIVKLIKSVMEK